MSPQDRRSGGQGRDGSRGHGGARGGGASGAGRSGAGRSSGGAGGAAPRSGGAGGGAPRSGGASSRGGAPNPGRPGAPWPRKPVAGARPPARASRAAVPTVDVHDPEGVRLQKVLASAGLGSRRACEELIAAGRVEVDGQVVTELGVRVDPKKAVIHVDGLRVQLDASVVTIALNKPKGVVSTMHDPEGRPSIGEYVANREERLFHVGRLDADSEGLILLTNDGELANRLSHPSSGVAKTYLVDVEGRVPPSLPTRLKKGVELEDGIAVVDEARIVQALPHASLVELVIHEGRNRVVRRIFDEVGYPVTRLVRTRIGPIRLGDLKQGRTRVLGKTEVGSLMTSVGL